MEQNKEILPKNVDLSALREVLPPFVARNWKEWSKFIPIARGTMANMDSKGIGPEGRVTIGNVVCYPRDLFIAWLEKRSSPIPPKS
jgi:hypothetical protein